MSQGLPVRLRLMVPAVENAIDGGAFRPGDVLVARSGKTSEIGNTGECTKSVVGIPAVTRKVPGETKPAFVGVEIVWFSPRRDLREVFAWSDGAVLCA